jgi:cysteinyl-tRNA synthetase
MTLRVYNTLTRQKEDFVPLTEGKVSMYVCGVTVYDLCHVGHARCYVAFDVIQRWLRKSYDVTYVRNFTDVDDKIIQRANETNVDPIALASKYADEFHHDMGELSVQKADVEPRVSTHMKEIVSFVESLVEKNIAYLVPSDSKVEGAGHDVYFRVNQFKNYTQLSMRNLDDMQAGARVDVDTRKESPLDFALWKSAKPAEPFWDSPFGIGRPGWHIECSAMSEATFGAQFDIHGGGKDLIFPHHTNEIAQSEARHDGKTYVNYWMHNGFVTVRDEAVCPVTQRSLGQCDAGGVVEVEHNGEKIQCVDKEAALAFGSDPEKYFKMSKSLGNFFTIREVTKRFTPESLRWLLLNTHYRNPILFSPRLMLEAERRVAYLYETLKTVSAYLEANEAVDGESLETLFAKDGDAFRPMKQFQEHMDDDFLTPAAMAVFTELLKIANLLCAGREKEMIGRKLKPPHRARLLLEWQTIVSEMTGFLGVGQKDPETFLLMQRDLRCRQANIDVEHVETLVARRQAARADKDFAAADAARDELTALGVEVRDTQSGSEWSVL